MWRLSSFEYLDMTRFISNTFNRSCVGFIKGVRVVFNIRSSVKTLINSNGFR
jgi:hypothetical protein